MQPNSFKSTVHAALAVTPITDRLAASSAVVLERIAMGGGATRWYYCPDGAHLEAVEAQLRPGSVVSFYFDARIQSGHYSPEIKSNAERTIAETGEVIIGVLGEDSLLIDVQMLTGLDELTEFASTIGSTSRVFYGVFPARDNDGVRAVTVTLPDTDGVIRPHPH
jgi:hypothetical protein